MVQNFNLRIAIAVMGFLSALFLTPLVPALAILALSLLFRSWEALILGLTVDLLWLPPGHAPLFTIGAIAAVWLLEPIRKEFLS